VSPRPEVSAFAPDPRRPRRGAGRVLALALAHGMLVLGAWGCFVFRNDPAAVARAFHAHLLGPAAAFRGRFQRAVFAVPAAPGREDNRRAFARASCTAPADAPDAPAGAPAGAAGHDAGAAGFAAGFGRAGSSEEGGWPEDRRGWAGSTDRTRAGGGEEAAGCGASSGGGGGGGGDGGGESGGGGGGGESTGPPPRRSQAQPARAQHLLY
jgi:hypothetical protein